jgi:RNA polymerase sigma-70 factor (ECF subfamily)
LATAAAPCPQPSAPTPRAGADEAVLRALVERIRQDDLAAFDQLYLLTRAETARTLAHLVGRRGDLEDLLQEVYLQLLTAVKKYRGEAQFRTFIYRVCANVALMNLRWRRRRPEDPMAEVPEPQGGAAASGSDPEREASRREAARLVQEALETLGPKKRIVFVYHELCGMGPEEIARAVDSSPNTVRSRLHHARLEFNEAMQQLLKSPRREALMACEHRSSLWAHAACELGASEREALEAHLAVCEECRAELQSVRATRELLTLAGEAPAQVDWRRADEQVRSAAARRLARLERGPASWVWASGLAAAAACLAVVFVQAGRTPPAEPVAVVEPAPPAAPGSADPSASQAAGAAVAEAAEGVRVEGAAGPLAAGATVAAGSRLETPASGRAMLKLPDGSRVRVAGESRLHLAQVAREEVRLQVERGRVAIKASHVERKGFVVEAAGVRVRVVGTAFSVGLSDGEVDVAVVEGKVSVELPDGRTRLVKAGERTVLDRKANSLSGRGLQESDREEFAGLEVELPLGSRPRAVARPPAAAPPVPAVAAPAPLPPAAPPQVAAPAPAPARPSPESTSEGLAPVPIEVQLLRRAEQARVDGRCGLFQEMLANFLEEPGETEGREQARWLRASCFAASGQPIDADAEFRRYLREFPDGPHAEEARRAVAH